MSMTPRANDHGGVSNDLADWFPIIAATGAPVPRTILVPTTEDLFECLVGGAELTPEAQADVDAVAAAVAEIGVPVFLRTGHLSAKHSWSHSCALTNPYLLLQHLHVLHETQSMAWGLPIPRHIAVREMLDTAHLFYALSGRMPVTRERRYFVDNAVVYDHHPYWPIGAIEAGGAFDAKDRELAFGVWTNLLGVDSMETAAEVAELTALTTRATEGLTGRWSVDWLWTTGRGWVLIDAAHAEESWVMSDADRQALKSDTESKPTP